MAGLPRRRGAIGIAVLAICATAVVGALLAPPPPPAMEAAEGCTEDFPRLVLPGRAELEGLVVCSDAAGTSTLVRNDTAAVWVVESDSRSGVHLLPLDEHTRSFAGLLDGSGSSVPAGAVAVVPQPPAGVRLHIDARLTMAQLAHDQLVATLGRKDGPALAALRPEPTVARRALVECLAGTLRNVPSPGCALADGRPLEVLAAAAAAIEADGRSLCGVLWLEAKANANLPSVDQTAFVADIVGWERNAGFTARADAAAAAYLQMQPEDRS
ncbi:hypothetical protein [Naasia sp. SYSU D00948]|uniref:hypothetical protein n=1 Tax=Naasia sp. SYSU D00948 TaxID=2817379 RepID=UPI001B3170A0|nr:hypothetical protein [Naasia sp. SYSU D00948]